MTVWKSTSLPRSTIFKSFKRSVSRQPLTPSAGDGAYSNVFKVQRMEDGKEYALKKVKLEHLSEKEKDNAINEVRILASIKHPNVIQFKEAFVDEASKSLW